MSNFYNDSAGSSNPTFGYVTTKIARVLGQFSTNEITPSTGDTVYISPNLDVAGNLTIHGDEILIGNQLVTGNLETTGTTQADGGLIADSLTALTADADLVLTGNGAGGVEVNSDLSVTGALAANAITASTLAATGAITTQAQIITDVIASKTPNSNISVAISPLGSGVGWFDVTCPMNVNTGGSMPSAAVEILGTGTDYECLQLRDLFADRWHINLESSGLNFAQSAGTNRVLYLTSSGNITTAGSVTTGGKIICNDTTDATGAGLGSVVLAGGLYSPKNIFANNLHAVSYLIADFALETDRILPNPAFGATSVLFDSGSSVRISATSNQIQLGNPSATYTTINAPAPATSRIYTIADVSADANFIMSESNQTINGNLETNNHILRRSGASKAEFGISTGSGNLFTSPSTGLTVSANDPCVGSLGTQNFHLGTNMTAGSSVPNISMNVSSVGVNTQLMVHNTDDSTGAFTGSFITRGGVYVDKQLRVNGATTLAALTATTGTFSGALTGTTGAFSGAVSMAALTATTGTFSSNVSMNNLTANVINANVGTYATSLTALTTDTTSSARFWGASGTTYPLHIRGTNPACNWIQLKDFADAATWNLKSGSGGNEFVINQAGSSDRLLINAGGNISIGNTNNTYKLDISGTLRATGLITAGAGISLPTTGGTAATLSDYEEFSQSISFNCRAGVAVAVTINIVKVGKQISLYVPAFSCTAGSSTPNNVMSTTSNVPSRFCPNGVAAFMAGSPRVSTAGGTPTLGMGFITAAGQLQIYLDAPLNVYAASSAAQLLTSCWFSYNIM